MVMAIDRVLETVAVTPRPSYQQTRVYSHLEISGHRRHKQEVHFRPVLAPVKYADTAYVYINNTHKRFVSRTFYEPRLRPRSFADTTFASPKTTQERFVTYLDAHAEQKKSWFKTSVEIKAKPQKFKSSVSYPNISSAAVSSSSHMNGNPLTNGYSPSQSHHPENGLDGSEDVDENMNRRIPVFKEKYDPGASQVFIPKRKEQFGQDKILDSISGQIIVNGFSDNKLCNGYSDMNGHHINGGVSDL